jgi:hypothetical protein
MTDPSNDNLPQPVLIDPLLRAVANAGKFEIAVDAQRCFYTAASHRPLIKRIAVRNVGWDSADEVVISVHTEAVGANSLLHPWAKAYPQILKGDTLTVDVLSIRPNLIELARLEESILGDIVVQVRVNDQVISELRQKVEFLAYNQWMHDKLDYECLSAFVFPNHPVVVNIMDGVRSRLLKETTDGTTDGYQRFFPPSEQSFQKGRIRVLEVVKAIFEELQSMGLEYSDPPQTFEGHGQKVRTPDVVIRDKSATCLDSAVLSASCFAAAGLSPLVFLVRGHAFPGVWWTPLNGLDDESGKPTIVSNRPGSITNVNLFQTLASQGLIMSFESTQVCRSTSQPFSVAVNRHEDYSSGNEVGSFQALIEVERSAELGVRRLPNRVAPQNGQEFSIEVDRSGLDVIRPSTYEALDDSPDAIDRVKLGDGGIPRRVRRWMDALLDISNTNPLINLVQLPVMFPEKGVRGKKGISLPMVPGLLPLVENRLMSGAPVRAICVNQLADNVLQDPSAETITNYFAASGALAVGPVDYFMRQLAVNIDGAIDEGMAPGDARMSQQAFLAKAHEFEATKRFRSLKKLADDTESESATNQLFLTIGTLVWDSPGDSGRATKQVRSPMFVVPVRLGGTAGSGFTITLDQGGEISPNYCLMEKLRSELGLRIAELENPNLDDSGIDVENTIATIRRQLGTSKFASMRIEEEAQLAVLDFATFRMWKDIHSNWELFSKNVVVEHLINSTNASLVQDLPTYAQEPMAPFSCDESQMEAVRWALEGRSFVLEGPPGTGKSQTIANMIAACMAEGKRILFVAEKQVALNAVSNKLEEIGLDPFCITMHHESTTPDSIRNQLRESLDFVGEDVSWQWDSENNQLSSLREQLIRYRTDIIEKNGVGFSAISAQQEVIRLRDGSSLDIDPNSFDLIGSNLQSIQSALLSIFGVVEGSRVVVDGDWRLANIDSVESVDWELLSQSIQQLQTLINQNQHLSGLISPLLNSPNVGGLSTQLSSAMNLVADGLGLSAADSSTVLDPSWMAGIVALTQQVGACKTSNAAVFDFFQTSAFEIDLSPQVFAANEAIGAGLFKKGKKAEILKNLLKPLVKGSLEKEPAELLTLLQRVAPVRTEVTRLQQAFLAIPLVTVRVGFDPLDETHIAELLASVEELRNRAQVLSAPEVHFLIRGLIDSGNSISRSDVQTVGLFLNVWNNIKNMLQTTEESLTVWRSGADTWAAIATSLPAWMSASPQFTYLKKASLIRKTLEPLKKSGMSKIVEQILNGHLALDDIYNEFMRGLVLAARNERLKNGTLSSFERSNFEKTLADFTRKDLVRRDLMQKVIPRQLSDSRPFKPGVRTGEIGNLERELGRKVRRVSVPQLIKEYGEMITRLAPCFLMSPEAVSRLLPADSQFFDIVVFDEASQIRVAAAIPAMGRAKAVVVVGDSQQMPPSRKIGQRQGGNDSEVSLDDEDISQDLESILSECSESHVPSLMLKCHFRSQHEGLIAFSNRNFYDGSLVTFPAPNTDKTTPISWFDVPNGQFERSGDAKGTNPQEAQAVVAEIVRRLNSPEHASKSIGVVTFNEVQAACISELLDEKAATDEAVARALANPKKQDRLFVVPLERVQGDERDTIILSVSYSYQGSSRKTVSPTWGPLTHKGGERRLNVAITRAKKDLAIFCSFDPNLVVVDSSTYDGVPFTVAFLKECRDASRANGVALTARDVSSLDYHRRMLLEILRADGIQVRENIGLSRFRIDLAINDEGSDEQFLALLLDGDEWTKRSTPFDRDVLPNSVMRLIGWRRIGRVWLKSVVDEPAHVLETVRNEIAREKLRQSMITALGTRGYEVRSDSRLSNYGVDFAIRKGGESSWPLAISINGPGLFSQFLPYEGSVPGAAELRSIDCVEALAVWIPDVQTDIDAVFTKIETAFTKATSTLAQISAQEVAARVEPMKVADMIAAANKDTSDSPMLLTSEMRSEFQDSKSMPLLGDQSILGPGAGANPSLVRKAIDEVVQFEGPITEQRLASVVVGRFGMSAVRQNRMESLRAQFAHLPKTQTPFGVVYWSDTRPSDSWRGFRTSSGDVTRNIDDVPAEEISNAMVSVVRLGDSGFREEIVRHTAEVFGRKAVTKVLKEKLNSILDWTVSQGRLVIDSELYKLPNP